MSTPAYAAPTVGTAASGTSVTAGTPASVTAGKLLLLAILCRNNNDTFVKPAWATVDLAPNVNLTWAALYARIATGDAGDTIPAMSSSGTNQCVAQCAAFGGDVYTDLATISHAAIDQAGNLASPNQNNIQYSALTPTLNATMLIALGGHNKTTTSNGATLTGSDVTGFTEMGQSSPNGSSLSFWWGYLQQSTAAAFAGAIQTRTGTSEALQQESLVIALRTKNVLAPKAAFYNSQMQ